MKNAHKKAKPSPDHSAVEPMSLTCACRRDLTFNELRGVYPRTNKEIIENFLPEINKACSHWGITTCLRKAHFLAQVSAETGDLTKIAETPPKDKKTGEPVPESRMYDGYKGRGLFQLTWERNYKAYGAAVGHNFLEGHKVELEKPQWAADSGAWFWSNSSLNDYADKNDFIFLVQRVNAGFNGWAARKRTLQQAARFLLVDACPDTHKCWDMNGFHFVNSALNNMTDYNANVAAFAWGYWFDPLSPDSVVYGNPRDETNAIEGYTRFLEMEAQDALHPRAQKQAAKKRQGRFFFKRWVDMVAHAKTRLNDLTKSTTPQEMDNEK